MRTQPRTGIRTHTQTHSLTYNTQTRVLVSWCIVFYEISIDRMNYNYRDVVCPLKVLYGTDEDAIYLRNHYRWYIFPNLNPDGYDYTWTTVSLRYRSYQLVYMCMYLSLLSLPSKLATCLINYSPTSASRQFTKFVNPRIIVS